MRPASRSTAFVLVGAMGFAWQLAVLQLLTWSGAPVEAGAAAGVAAAILHNFVWHRRYTWADRRRTPPTAVAVQFLRFAGLNGVVSLVGNVVLTGALVRAGVPVLVSNALAVCACSLANFVLSDRLVFATSLLLAGAAVADAAVLTPPTLAAWDDYVRATEARVRAQDMRPGTPGLGADAWRRLLAGELLMNAVETRRPDGSAIGIPNGTVHHWVGRVFLPGADLDSLLRELEAPTTRRWLPGEVRAMRVVSDDGGGLRVSMRVERESIVDVTYDIEHAVRYSRHAAGHATSRSVSRRIVEVEGAGTARERALPEGRDHGFLWRLNAYWRYVPVHGGVLVECESLALSRSVPLVLRAVAWPLVDRVSRESLASTLAALQQGFRPGGGGALRTSSDTK